MKIRLDDEALLGDLISFLRRDGLIASFGASAEAVEALAPHRFGDNEAAAIRRLVDIWAAAHLPVAITMTE